MKIGVFGGTFDPIHLGHLSAAEDAACHLGLDQVLFVPNRVPPHKQGRAVSQVRDRVAMVDLAVADNSLFATLLVELERAGPSYTLDTLRELRLRQPQDRLYFLVGSDALPDLHTWSRPQDILREFQVVVLERPTGTTINWAQIEEHFPEIRRQVKIVPVAQLDISASDIRRRVVAGCPIRYQVIPAVEAYIERRGLYQG